MNNIIITGPTGAIGIALINKCISEGIYVSAVCHKGSKRITDVPKSEYVDIVECNLDEMCNLPDLLPDRDYDTFIHLAWDCTFGESRNNVDAQITNIRYTIDAVEAAHKLGCGRFIGAGSQAEYGRVDKALTADTPTFPENGYGIAKLCAGQLSRLRCEQLGIDHIWTRILSVYGPCDGQNTLVSSLVRRIREHEHVACTPGTQIWDYIYSADAAEAIFLLMQKGIPGKTYVLGSGEAHPLKEYIEKIKNAIDTEAEIGYGEIQFGPLQVMHLEADISDLRNDTGFEPKVSFEEGIDKLLSWYEK